VGKQSRRKGQRQPGTEVAARYFRRVGLALRANPAALARLGDADPAWAAQLAELDSRTVAMAEDPTVSPGDLEAASRAKYALIYRDLDTALAEYAARAVVVAGALLPWWLDHRPAASRLLDIGCGAGVLTCAYALAMPDSEVVGIDVVPEAIACAEELATRLGAGNARFLAADFTAPPGSLPPAEGYEQVVAVTVLGDAVAYPKRRPGQDPFSSVAEVDGAGLGYTTPGLTALADRLAAGGTLLVFDRTPEAVQALWLGAGLRNAGLDLDLGRAEAVELIEDAEPRTFTRFIGRHSNGAGAAADLASWVKSAEPPAYGRAWHDELRLERLKAAGATLVFGVEIDYSQHSPLVERLEAWAHGSTGYHWTTNSGGLRQLSRAATPEAVAAEIAAYARKWAAAGLPVRRYDGR
jgi:SAM-dependent methyltransferase